MVSLRIILRICLTYNKVKLAAERGRLVYVTPALVCKKSSSRGKIFAESSPGSWQSSQIFENSTLFTFSDTCILLQCPQKISRACRLELGNAKPYSPMATSSGCPSPSQVFSHDFKTIPLVPSWCHVPCLSSFWQIG